jgi:hypothetical protein
MIVLLLWIEDVAPAADCSLIRNLREETEDEAGRRADRGHDELLKIEN